MNDLRATVIEALDRASGFLTNPQLARLTLSGQDFDLDRLGLDSLTRFEALMELEDRLLIEIDDDELGQCRTLDQLTAFLRSRVG
jgi:acyl carrier protein